MNKSLISENAQNQEKIKELKEKQLFLAFLVDRKRDYALQLADFYEHTSENKSI